MAASIERLTLKDQANNVKLYELYELFNGYLDGWNSESQQDNFETLATIEAYADFPLEDTSCLDVGCGTGEMFPFLRDRDVGSYLGIDVLSDEITKAREKYPEGVFRQGDFLVEPEGEKFDYVFCSGTFITYIPSGNYEYLGRMISRMWKVSKKGIAFNYISDDTPSIIPWTFSYSRDKVLQIAEETAPEGEIMLVSNVLGDGNYQDTVFILH